METLINALANDVLTSGAISEAHILLGLFIVTIIALRKAKPVKTDDTIHNEVTTKLDELSTHLETLTMQDEIRKHDIEMIQADITEIKNKLDSIDIKLR